MSAVPSTSTTAKAIPRVIVTSQIRPGTNAEQNCGVADRAWLEIGAYGSPSAAPRAVDDRGKEGDDLVAVECAVVREADAFRVNASAGRLGAGSIRVAGTFRPVKSEPQTGVTVTFDRPDLGTFTQTDCVASYDTNPLATVAAGRVWFRVACPRAVSPATP